MFPVRERLHLRQVRVLLERQRFRNHDRLVQQLLQDVRQVDEARVDARGIQGRRQTQDGVKVAQSLFTGQAKKGRN